MANLVAMNIKRKDAEVASHGFSIFLDPKRIKLQDLVQIPEMMEEEKPIAYPDTAAPPPANLPIPLLSTPTQGQEAAAHGITVSTETGDRSSETPLAADQAAPMDIEDDVRQTQPGQHPQFWSGE
ncbi:hypothetical protein HU200_039961 [Digitaria exilis]|uniref:Uncharacterized protein n=1 Tax=Digitaria exilis TaxID=1010633 RepID=A0A835B9P6_9POAL|nr:hypothetical protein HU200_039961 [Digitaria exilis]